MIFINLLFHLIFIIGLSSSEEGSKEHTDSAEAITKEKGRHNIRTDILNRVGDVGIKVPPQGPNGSPVIIHVVFTLNHFSVNELEQTFVASAWLSMKWNDPRLKWNSTEKFNLKFGQDEIWHPDLTLYNNAFPTEVFHYGDTHTIVHSDGNVSWIPPARLHSLCNFNFIRWPFDEQTCSLKFGSWSHSGDEIDLRLFEDETQESVEIDRATLLESNEWGIINAYATRNRLMYACCEEPFYDITFTFNIQRKSSFNTVTVILPIIVISLVNIMIFLLPPSSGEKITLASINSLIICSYLIHFEWRHPEFGDHIPLIVFMYAVNLILVGISIIISIVVIRLSRFKRLTRPPQCMRIFCNSNFANLLGLGYYHPYASSNYQLNDNGCEGVEMDSRGEFASSLDNEHNEMDGGPSEWLLLAAIIDRISLIIYLVIWGIVIGLCL